MGLGHLLDHEVTVHRPSLAGDAGGLATLEESWDSSRTGVGAAIQTKSEKREDEGGGRRTTGAYLGFMDAGADVLEGDVLEVTAGPGSWGFLEVVGKNEPRGHHVELELDDTDKDPTV